MTLFWCCPLEGTATEVHHALQTLSITYAW